MFHQDFELNDGYSDPFSFNGAENMYAADIENLWPETQAENNVPGPMNVLFAIWHGYNLTTAALTEYLQGSLAVFKIVSFGHSHNPMIHVFPAGNAYTGIYANSGSWIDADKCSHPVRTCLIIKPAKSTGSDINVVMLYQYNPQASGNANTFVPELMAEESILD